MGENNSADEAPPYDATANISARAADHLKRIRRQRPAPDAEDKDIALALLRECSDPDVQVPPPPLLIELIETCLFPDRRNTKLTDASRYHIPALRQISDHLGFDPKHYRGANVALIWHRLIPLEAETRPDPTGTKPSSLSDNFLANKFKVARRSIERWRAMPGYRDAVENIRAGKPRI